jgi:hypothetical protein
VPDVAFVLVAERGSLEWQALLLVDSIRRWCGRLSSAPVYVVSPRPERRPRPAVLAALEKMGAEYVDSVRNQDPSGYGTVNRIVAGAYIERTTDHEVLVVLDSDTLFLREPEALTLDGNVDAAARPVDVIGLSSTGPDDPREAYWQAICRIAGIHRDALPTMTSFAGDRFVAQYNGGLVSVRRGAGILESTEAIFFEAMAAGLRPNRLREGFRTGAGPVPANVAKLWGSSQVALTVAVWSRTRRVVVLPPTYNVPLHRLDRMPDGMTAAFATAVHVHYHWLLDPGEPLDPLRARSDSPLNPEQRSWLTTALDARDAAFA